MTDIELDHLRQGGDGGHILKSQAMPGMNLKPELVRQLRRLSQTRQFVGTGIVAGRIRIGPGMKFDDMRADILSGRT